jgi:hypothetical protein
VKPDDLKPEDLIRIWEKTVETQMHFNEMSVKSRQLGFTFVAAALGVAAFLLSRGEDFSILFPSRYGIFHPSHFGSVDCDQHHRGLRHQET